MNNNELERLRAFRHQLYRILECRRDALFEIMDAVLTATVIESPVHLSLAAGFQRNWGSVYDALNQGTFAPERWEECLADSPLETETNWYAIDGSVWPRCDAETSPERGYYHHAYRHSNGQPIVAGWNYSWLVQLPERCSSWTAPLRIRRIIPGETSNAIAAEQIRSHQRQCRKKGRRQAIYSMDAGYDPVAMGEALQEEENVCLLIRLRSGRCFYAEPPALPTGGRPRKHGRKFTCDKPLTWWEPTREWSQQDAGYGQVRLRAWSGLHAIPATHGKHAKPQPKPIVPGWVILVEVERLPKPTKRPEALWLWWWGKEPPSLDAVWRVYVSRFAIEHMFRFFKQVLKWTTPKLRSPEAADRWTWLLTGVYVQLRLAQSLVADHRLPWQQALPPERLTPARVRRSFSKLLPKLGSPVNVPKPCGISPGRPKGRRSRPAKRIPAVKLTA
jgi:DDE superfamily endonuclease